MTIFGPFGAYAMSIARRIQLCDTFSFAVSQRDTRVRLAETRSGHHGQERFPIPFVGRDIDFRAQGEIDVVQAFQQPQPREIVERERPGPNSRTHFPAYDVDRDPGRRVSVDGVPEGLHGGDRQLDRNETLLERIPPEDIAEARRDDRPETPVAP